LLLGGYAALLVTTQATTSQPTSSDVNRALIRLIVPGLSGQAAYPSVPASALERSGRSTEYRSDGGEVETPRAVQSADDQLRQQPAPSGNGAVRSDGPRQLRTAPGSPTALGEYLPLQFLTNPPASFAAAVLALALAGCITQRQRG
jgi:hypothetical protein